MSYTMVSFHAHPDDEALLMSGTIARATAEGNRVVVVIATSGELGLAAHEYTDGGNLGATRRQEALRSARALGVSRVVFLDYIDSGSGPELFPNPPGQVRFANADIDEAAAQLANVLREEQADVLTTYDAAGGYGHRDHKQVHVVGARAAEMAGTPSVLEATIDRDILLKGISLAERVYTFPEEFDIEAYKTAYTPRAELTHKVNVRAYIVEKRVSFRCHASQATADEGDRTLGMALKLPRSVFRLVLGHEWFREVGRPVPGPGERLLDDVFATAREARR